VRDRVNDLADDVLMRVARKLAGAALTADDVLLDVTAGNLLRFRDNGVDQPVVTPKRWARALPVARGLTIVTYTEVQLLLVGDGFAANGALVGVTRAEVEGDNQLTIAFTPRASPLGLVSLHIPSRSGQLANGFVERLLASRDEQRKKMAAQSQTHFAKLDSAVQTPTIEELWSSEPFG
jgi:hypothetical protein